MVFRPVYDKVAAHVKKHGTFKFDNPKAGSKKIVQKFIDTFTDKEKTKYMYIGETEPNSKVREGRGITVSADGVVYQGYYIDNKREGKGKLFHANGDCHEGQFKNDLEHGQGKYTFGNDMAYTQGDYVNGKEKGVHKMFDKNGKPMKQSSNSGSSEGSDDGSESGDSDANSSSGDAEEAGSSDSDSD